MFTTSPGSCSIIVGATSAPYDDCGTFNCCIKNGATSCKNGINSCDNGPVSNDVSGCSCTGSTPFCCKTSSSNSVGCFADSSCTGSALAVSTGTTPTYSPTSEDKLLQVITNDLGTGMYDECTGDCDLHTDCIGDDLMCFYRDGDESVPGCDNDSAVSGVDYCVKRTPQILQEIENNLGESSYGRCEGVYYFPSSIS